MTQRRTLANVTERHGRVDVALYRIAERLLMQFETERGVTGLRETVLPLVEHAIRQTVPARNLIPPEIEAVVYACRYYQGRLCGHQ